MGHVTHVTGRFYRMKFLAEADDILGPARAPEGRAHYGGQKALYLSGSPEGTVIASRLYMKPGDAPRGIFCLQIDGARVVDLRDDTATAYFGIDVSQRAVDWQSLRRKGLRSPTWTISDKVRKLGLDGMLYASRKDPENTHHLTLFGWNTPGRPRVRQDGAPVLWSEGS